MEHEEPGHSKNLQINHGRRNTTWTVDGPRKGVEFDFNEFDITVGEGPGQSKRFLRDSNVTIQDPTTDVKKEDKSHHCELWSSTRVRYVVYPPRLMGSQNSVSNTGRVPASNQQLVM